MGLGEGLLEVAGGGVEDVDVALDLGSDARPLDLEDHALATLDDGLVDLADAGRGQVLFFEGLELGPPLGPEVALQLAVDVLEADGLDVVLEGLELDDDALGQEVGPGREDLTKLDPRRTEGRQGPDQALAGVGAGQGRAAEVGGTLTMDEWVENLMKGEGA